MLADCNCSKSQAFQFLKQPARLTMGRENMGCVANCLALHSFCQWLSG